MICRSKRSAMANARDARRSGSRKTHKPPTGDLHSIFADVYGSRWGELYQALARPTEHVALQNAFASGADLANADWKRDIAVGPTKASTVALLSSVLFRQALDIVAEWWQVCSYAHQGQTYPQPSPDPHTRLLSWYWLDRASLLPPLLLNPLPGQTVLDMCSAPGGKSLMLAYMLFARKGFPPTASGTATTATTAASHTAGTHPGQAQATSDPHGEADNTSAIDCSSSLSQNTLECNTAGPLPQQHNLSSQTHTAAAAASTPHEHEQANASSDEQTQASTHHPPKSQVPCIHIRTDAIDLAEHDTLAEPGEGVAELASTPATLSAQHGQNVALSASLTCNELDAPRRSRLHSVLDMYLPAPLKRKVRYDSGAMLYQLPLAFVVMSHSVPDLRCKVTLPGFLSWGKSHKLVHDTYLLA